MSEWVEVSAAGKVVQVDMKDVRSGDRFRINTASMPGPWRTAASNAVMHRGKWTVATVHTSRRPARLYPKL